MCMYAGARRPGRTGVLLHTAADRLRILEERARGSVRQKKVETAESRVVAIGKKLIGG